MDGQTPVVMDIAGDKKGHEIEIPQPWLLQWTTATLDALSVCIIITDAELRCLFANRAARGVLRRGPVLLEGNQLQCDPPGHLQKLRQAVRSTLAPQRHRPQVNVVTVSDGADPLRILVGAIGAPPHEAAGLFIAPPNGGRAADRELMCQVFGFSRMEADVVELLCRGLQPAEVATALRLSLHTVRNYMRAAFAKSEVHRQSELLREVLRGPGMLRL